MNMILASTLKKSTFLSDNSMNTERTNITHWRISVGAQSLGWRPLSATNTADFRLISVTLTAAVMLVSMRNNKLASHLRIISVSLQSNGVQIVWEWPLTHPRWMGSNGCFSKVSADVFSLWRFNTHRTRKLTKLYFYISYHSEVNSKVLLVPGYFPSWILW